MAVTSVFTCGAECGYLPSHWTSITGPVTVSAVQKNYGANSIKVTAAGAATYARFTTASPATGVLRVAVYFPTSLPAADCVLATFSSITGNNGYLAFNQTTGKLVVGQQSDWANCVVGPSVVAGTWYTIDLKVTMTTATSPIIAWAVNGTAQTGFTGSGATGTCDWWSIGQEDTALLALTTYTAYFDDVLFSGTAADYPLGAGQVIGYRPTSDGTHTATGTTTVKGTTATPVGTAITSATTDAYQWVDDASIDGTGDFWNAQTAASTTYVEVNFSDITDIPRAVEALVSISAATTAANTQKAVLYDGTTAVDIYASSTVGVQHPTLAYKRAHYAAAPTGAWTVAYFNALRVRWGYSSDATPDAYCDNIVLEVETAVVSGYAYSQAVVIT